MAEVISEADADEWWSKQTAARKRQVYRWLNPTKGVAAPVPGQLEFELPGDTPALPEP